MSFRGFDDGELRAFRVGIQARAIGVERTDNPFHPSNRKRYAWFEGFDVAGVRIERAIAELLAETENSQ